MICARCQQFAVVPGGLLCARCAVPAPPFGVLRSPVGLGRATAGLLGLVVAVDLFAVVADVTQMNISGDIADGAFGAAVARRAERADTLYNVAGTAQLVALLATISVYLCWMWRARVNAEVFSPGGQTKARGWTIGGWFVPIVNLWFPRRIVLDIWDSSLPWTARRSHALVNFWWTAWIVSLFADRAATRQYDRADGAAELRDAARMMLFNDMVDIVAAVLAALVVLKITRMQHQRALGGPVVG